eukprot:jgi/Botrbrau1/1785/Bobra.0217s0040.1
MLLTITFSRPPSVQHKSAIVWPSNIQRCCFDRMPFCLHSFGRVARLSSLETLSRAPISSVPDLWGTRHLQSQRPAHLNRRLSNPLSLKKRCMASAAGFGEVPVTKAQELVQGGTTYLDVRTEGEFVAGHVPGAINVPFMLSGPGGMTPNPKFLEDVEAALPDKDTPILVGCKSGARSTRASMALAAANYKNLWNVAGGFDDWTAKGLPKM